MKVPLLGLVFILVPLLEIYLLIVIGSEIGALATILLIFITAVIGVAMLRVQGISTFMRLQGTLARGGLPALEMLEGVALVIGGALLLTPGFFTDAVGFLCLLPASRHFVIQRLLGWGLPKFVHRRGGPPFRSSDPDVIEGEYRKRDDHER